MKEVTSRTSVQGGVKPNVFAAASSTLSLTLGAANAEGDLAEAREGGSPGAALPLHAQALLLLLWTSPRLPSQPPPLRIHTTHSSVQRELAPASIVTEQHGTTPPRRKAPASTMRRAASQPTICTRSLESLWDAGHRTANPGYGTSPRWHTGGSGPPSATQESV